MFSVRHGRPRHDDQVELAARCVLTDDELSRIIRETYKRVMARDRRTTERALKTCEALLRIHRATEGRDATRAWIARMLAEEPLGSPHPAR